MIARDDLRRGLDHLFAAEGATDTWQPDPTNDAAKTANTSLTPSELTGEIKGNVGIEWIGANIFVDSLSGYANLTAEENRRSLQLDEFLDEIYLLTDAGMLPRASDRVIDFIDRLLGDGFFRVCDELLRRIDLARVPSSLRRAFLKVTHPAKDKLIARSRFFDAALGILVSERGEQKANKMLRNLA